jgi:hypothetical protein
MMKKLTIFTTVLVIGFVAQATAEDLPTEWGKVVDGLSIGIKVERDKFSVAVDVYLKNQGDKSVNVSTESLRSPPQFLIASGEKNETTAVAIPSAVNPVRIGQPHVLPKPFSEIKSGAVLHLGKFVIGPIDRLGRVGNCKVTGVLTLQHAPAKPEIPVEGKPPVIELLSNAVPVPAMSPRTSDEQMMAVFDGTIVGIWVDDPKVPIEEVIIRVAKDKNAKPLTRAFATHCLGRLSGAKAIEALKILCNDNDEDLRASAVWSLARIQTQSALPVLKQLYEDQSLKVRAAVASGLGFCGAKDSVPLLIKYLQRDDAPAVRENAARTLALLGGDEASEALRGALKDSHYNVRYNVILALKKLKDKRAIEHLVAFVENAEPSDSISQSEALKAIDEITGIEFKGDVKRIKEFLQTQPKTNK